MTGQCILDTAFYALYFLYCQKRSDENSISVREYETSSRGRLATIVVKTGPRGPNFRFYTFVGRLIELLLFQDDFDTLRPLCYPNTDVFLVCFSVVNPSSFENLKLRWIPEIRHHSTRTPFILVGTECDLRTNIKVLLDLHRHQLTPVTEAQARQFAEEVGAATYLECSSLTQQNLKETFDAAILVGLEASNLGEDGKAAPGSSIPGRKSLRKLKEKLTASRTNSVDSVKNPAFRVKNGDLTPEVQQRPVERYSTHSSASHVNARGRHNKNKLSTASVPTIGVELNAVVMNTDGIRGDQYPVGNGRDKALSPPDSETAKSRRGWRKLLCVA